MAMRSVLQNPPPPHTHTNRDYSSSVNLEVKHWIIRNYISCRLTNASFSSHILTPPIKRNTHAPAVYRLRLSLYYTACTRNIFVIYRVLVWVRSILLVYILKRITLYIILNRLRQAYAYSTLNVWLSKWFGAPNKASGCWNKVKKLKRRGGLGILFFRVAGLEGECESDGEAEHLDRSGEMKWSVAQYEQCCLQLLNERTF